MPKNLQNKISHTKIKHCNPFRSLRTEDLRWVQLATDTGIKLKV